MTARADILAGAQDAISQLASGETWEYATLTSEPGVDPAVYSAYAALSNTRRAMQSSGVEADPERSGWADVARAVISTNATTVLRYGDRIRDGAGDVWAFDGIQSEGIGHRLIRIKRELPLLQARDGEAMP